MNQPTLIGYEFHGEVIRQRASDGFLNATAMCKIAKKDWYEYYRSKNTQDFFKALSKHLNMPIESSVSLLNKSKGLVEIVRGGNYAGTWIHTKVAENLYIWLSKTKSQQAEKAIQLKLQAELGGEIEVKTPVGRIDLLTNSQLIEIKAGKDWIHAVGQVIIYGNYYPKHQKRIHLFSDEPATAIDKHCTQLGIELTREQ